MSTLKRRQLRPALHRPVESLPPVAIERIAERVYCSMGGLYDQMNRRGVPAAVRSAMRDVRFTLCHAFQRLMGEVTYGRCRVCGCSEEHACAREGMPPCSWADDLHMLCNNPDCLRTVKEEEEVAKVVTEAKKIMRRRKGRKQ